MPYLITFKIKFNEHGIHKTPGVFIMPTILSAADREREAERQLAGWYRGEPLNLALDVWENRVESRA